MQPVRRSDNFTTFMCQLFCNLGASNFCKSHSLFRPVMGLLYIYVCDFVEAEKFSGRSRYRKIVVLSR
jgi:hypothetical protein